MFVKCVVEGDNDIRAVVAGLTRCRNDGAEKRTKLEAWRRCSAALLRTAILAGLGVASGNL